jgi:rubrerythrin
MVPKVAIVLVISIVILGLPGAMAQPTAYAGEDKTDYTGNRVFFQGVGTPEPSLPIVLYEWDFDSDGLWDWNSTIVGSVPHVYTGVGVYNATFRVTQYNASSETPLQSAMDVIKVTIKSGQPVGKITSSTSAEVNKDFELASNFYDPDGGQLTYTWTIDGTVSQDEVFVHRFKEVGVFNITLEVVDDENETAKDQLLLEVVKELKEDEGWLPTNVIVGITVVLLLLLAVAIFAFTSIRRHAKVKEDEEVPAATEETETPIIEEASLEEDRVEPLSARTRPKVVSPTKLAAEEKRAGEVPPKVPAAPDRMPCPECGTTMDEEGACPFCEANEAIDSVEHRVVELKKDGFILAKVEDRVEAAKTALHVKHFGEVDTALEEAREAIGEAVRDHERSTKLMVLVEELIHEARDKDLDVTKAANLLKLARSFLKSGKYPKAIQYGEKSRDFLIEILEPFDLDKYFCQHCRNEVSVDDDHCPTCEQPIESGLLKRAKRELVELKKRFEGLAGDHREQGAIASQLEKAREHVESRSSAAANEAIGKARELLDGTAAPPEEVRAQESVPEETSEPDDIAEGVADEPLSRDEDEGDAPPDADEPDGRHPEEGAEGEEDPERQGPEG